MTLLTLIVCVLDMKRKLEKLNNLWNDVQKATSDRGRSLEDALAIAERFWDELQSVMATLRDLQDSLNSQEPPAVRPDIIHQQRVALQEIKAEIDQVCYAFKILQSLVYYLLSIKLIIIFKFFRLNLRLSIAVLPVNS